MNPPAAAPEQGGRDDDATTAWVDALQGREPGAHPTAAGTPVADVVAAARAGRLLRHLVLQAQQATGAKEEAYAQALLARWRAAGLLAPRPAHSLAARWALTIRQGLLGTPARRAAASTLALAGVLMGVWVTQAPPLGELPHAAPDGDAAVMRGADAVLQVGTSDPAALAQRVEALLLEHQIKLRRVDLPSGSVQLQAKVPADAQAARQGLVALGLPVPAHGRLDVVISKAR